MITRFFICRVNYLYHLIYTHLYHIYSHVWLRYDFQIPAWEGIVTIRSSKRHCWRSKQLFWHLCRKENTVNFYMHPQSISGVTFISTPITQFYVEMISFVAIYIFSSNSVTYIKPQTIHSINVAVVYDYYRKQGHVL